MKKSLVSYRVIYGDTDQMGVVYYANYLRWFEMGRTEFLRQMDTPYTSVEKIGVRFPVVEVSCRYFRPSRYDETIIIETTLTALDRATLTFSYKLHLEGDKRCIASGWTRHACVDEKGQITKIPSSLETALKPACSSEGG